MSTAITVLVFYVLAGRWDVPWLWATAAAASLVTLPLTLTIDPGLARERQRPGPGGRDRGSQVALAIVIGAQVLIACLDVGRFRWSTAVPPAVHLLGLVFFVAGFGLVTWSAVVNRFFSSVVRIQSERGHAVIASGPYRYLRHPGYLGMVMGYPAISLAIGSWWALIPGAICVLIVLRRAVLEDVYLLTNLPGYQDYAAAVPNRLIPCVW